jgi:hypothetical protein
MGAGSSTGALVTGSMDSSGAASTAGVWAASRFLRAFSAAAARALRICAPSALMAAFS